MDLYSENKVSINWPFRLYILPEIKSEFAISKLILTTGLNGLGYILIISNLSGIIPLYSDNLAPSQS